MLPAMPPARRVTPLAGWSVVATFVLIGIALVSTVWSTRALVIDASDAVGAGQTIAMESTVRDEIADLEGPPTAADLATLLRNHQDEGLRYVAMVERRRIVAEVGQPFGSGVDPRTNSKPEDVGGGRLRQHVRPFKSMRQGSGNWRIIIELEPVQAAALRSSATLTLGVGALAAASLLGVAIVLVRREARRNAEERARERERRLASLGEMSAVLAHEIRNPLASLKGNAQLLAAGLPSGEKPRAKAERVVDEAVRLEQLVTDLLQFVRTGEIRRAPVDPGALVREAAGSVDGEVTIETAGAPTSWTLDAGRIRQVVVNLVDNAVAAGPPASASVRAMAGKLVIEVADHGPGIPEEDRERIFEPFFTGKTRARASGSPSRAA